MAKIYKIFLLLLLVAIFPTFAHAADLSITPSNATYEVGDTITLQVVASSNAPLNAISGAIQFPTSIFSIESVSKSNSILSFWVTEPSLSKATGVVNFEGVALSGYTGNSGNVVTIRVKALKSGSGQITFQSGQILANDGQGTNITGTLNGTTLTITEPKVKPTVEEPKTKPAPVPVVEEVQVQPEPVQPAPSLKAPEISLGSKYGSPAIYGLSDYPKEQALITFVSESGTKIFINGVTDINGDFVISVPNSLKRGTYTVNAVIIMEDGKNSLISKDITINIGNIFSDTNPESYGFMCLLLVIVIFQFWRINHTSPKHLSKRIKSELEATEETVHKSFDILREDIKEKKMPILKTDVDDAEDLISKKVKKIESL